MIDILCGWEPPWPGARSVRERLRARPRAGREKGWAAPGGAAEGAGPPSEKGRRRGPRRRVEATSGPRRLHEGIALAAADAHGSPLVTVGKAFNASEFHEGLVREVTRSLRLAIVAPTLDRTVVGHQHPVCLTNACLHGHLVHNAHASGGHVEDGGWSHGAATEFPRRGGLRSLGSLLPWSCHHVRHRGPLGPDPPADERPAALGDVHGALPTSANLDHGVAQGNLHGLGEDVFQAVAELAVGVGAPGEDPFALGDCGRVRPAAINVSHLLGFDHALHLVRLLLAHATLAMEAPAQLAVVVVPPGEDLPLLGQNGHVHVTRRDLRELLPLDAGLTVGLVPIAPSVLEFPREVGSLEAAPRPELATFGHGQGEAPTASHLSNVSFVGQLCVNWESAVLLVASAELPEVVLTPTEDAAALAESHGVLHADGDLADPLPSERQDGAGRLTLGLTPAVGSPEP